MEQFFSQNAARQAVVVACACLALFLGAKAVTEVKGWKFIGSGTTATNTIAVSATQLPAALGPQTPATSLSIARPAATATLQSAATATGNGTAWSMEGLEFATFHVGGITTATITWETLNDATSGWVALLLTNQTSGALSTTATADGIYAVNCAGLNQIRARISAYTSGTISVLGRGA